MGHTNSAWRRHATTDIPSRASSTKFDRVSSHSQDQKWRATRYLASLEVQSTCCHGTTWIALVVSLSGTFGSELQRHHTKRRLLVLTLSPRKQQGLVVALAKLYRTQLTHPRCQLCVQS